MTTKARFESKTPHSLWLREQPDIDSKFGYNTCDIDYVWSNGLFYLVMEEKRFMAKMSKKQNDLYKIIHNDSKNNIMYKGCHIIQFENTTPDDGKVFIDGNEVSRNTYIKWLRFEAHNDMYNTIMFDNDKFISNFIQDGEGDVIFEMKDAKPKGMSKKELTPQEKEELYLLDQLENYYYEQLGNRIKKLKVNDIFIKKYELNEVKNNVWKYEYLVR